MKRRRVLTSVTGAATIAAAFAMWGLSVTRIGRTDGGAPVVAVRDDQQPAAAPLAAAMAPVARTATPTAISAPWVAGITAYGLDETIGNHRLDEVVAANPPGLRDVLIAVAKDPQHGWRWRNYIVQHLSTYALGADDVVACAAIIDATADPEDEIRDTAVYSLARLRKLASDGSAIAATVAARLPAVVEAAVADRSAAVQEAAMRSLALSGAPDGSAYAIAEGVASDRQRPVAVQVAAIDALAVLDAGRARSFALARTGSAEAGVPAAVTRALARAAGP